MVNMQPIVAMTGDNVITVLNDKGHTRRVSLRALWSQIDNLRRGKKEADGGSYDPNIVFRTVKNLRVLAGVGFEKIRAIWKYTPTEPVTVCTVRTDAQLKQGCGCLFSAMERQHVAGKNNGRLRALFSMKTWDDYRVISRGVPTVSAKIETAKAVSGEPFYGLTVDCDNKYIVSGCIVEGVDAVFLTDNKPKEVKKAETHDPVNNPEHYSYQLPDGCTLSCIDCCEDMSFNEGNAFKYVFRAGRKTVDCLQDMKKALWYLKRELERRDQGIDTRSSLSARRLACIRKLAVAEANQPQQEETELLDCKPAFTEKTRLSILMDIAGGLYWEASTWLKTLVSRLEDQEAEVREAHHLRQ